MEPSSSASSSPFSTRAATEADIDALVHLLSVLFAIEKDFVIDESKQREGLGMLLQSPSAIVLVAVANDDGKVGASCPPSQ